MHSVYVYAYAHPYTDAHARVYAYAYVHAVHMRMYAHVCVNVCRSIVSDNIYTCLYLYAMHMLLRIRLMRICTRRGLFAPLGAVGWHRQAILV